MLCGVFKKSSDRLKSFMGEEKWQDMIKSLVQVEGVDVAKVAIQHGFNDDFFKQPKKK